MLVDRTKYLVLRLDMKNNTKNPLVIMTLIAMIGISGNSKASVAIVFDGSASMCGYFLPNDQQRVLLNLIKQSMIIRNPNAGKNVLTLGQVDKKKSHSKTGLTLVPANFQAQAEILAQNGKQLAGGCAPFDGDSSNLDLVFDAKLTPMQSDAFVLISDTQFKEEDRDKFLAGYEDWANKTIQAGKTPYAGYVIAQVPFAGTYYSRAQTGTQYTLAAHSRPLALFWFARGEQELEKINSLIKAFGNSQKVVQHLLPFTKVDTFPLEIKPFSAVVTLPQLLLNHKVATIQRFATGRSEQVIRSCLVSDVEVEEGHQEIELEVQKLCADNRPFWDEVTSINYAVQLQGITPQTQYVLDGWQYNAKTKSFEISINRSFQGKDFHITPSLPKAENAQRTSLVNWSVDSDFCPQVKECLSRLNGRTYQLDMLSQQLVISSEEASKALLEPLKNTVFHLKMKVK
jgi:hypothetical protein